MTVGLPVNKIPGIGVPLVPLNDVLFERWEKGCVLEELLVVAGNASAGHDEGCVAGGKKY